MLEFFRGATPTHKFTLPMSADLLEAARISYAQNNVVLVRKYLDDCTVEENVLSVKLTENDTMCFKSTSPVELQMIGRCEDGSKLISPIVTISVKRIVDDEPLT